MSKQFLRFTHPFTGQRFAVPVARILRLESAKRVTRIVFDDQHGPDLFAKESLEELVNELEEIVKTEENEQTMKKLVENILKAGLQSSTKSATLNSTVTASNGRPERGDEPGKQV